MTPYQFYHDKHTCRACRCRKVRPAVACSSSHSCWVVVPAFAFRVFWETAVEYFFTGALFLALACVMWACHAVDGLRASSNCSTPATLNLT